MTSADSIATSTTIRRRAAAQLSLVSRDEALVPGARLHCLAAVQALDVPHAIGGDLETDPVRGITAALQLLGRLPSAEFAQTDILTAARSARRALRELR